MKILVVGGTGIIGKEIVKLLSQAHEVIAVGKTNGDYQVNIEDKTAIEQMFKDHPNIDGVISAAGNGMFAPFHSITDEQLDMVLNNKLKGQVNLIRVATKYIKDNGFIIVTSGVASQHFMPGASSITMACLGLEGFVRAIEIEKINHIRINAVSPGLVTESAKLFGFDITGSIPAADTASVYQEVMKSDQSGTVVSVPEYLTEAQET